MAFSTRMSEDTSINDSPVIFGTVDLNIGDGYDEFTGKFVPNISLLLLWKLIPLIILQFSIFLQNYHKIVFEFYKNVRI